MVWRVVRLSLSRKRAAACCRDRIFRHGEKLATHVGELGEFRLRHRRARIAVKLAAASYRHVFERNNWKFMPIVNCRPVRDGMRHEVSGHF